MTKEQFLFQLEQKLLDIPEDERAEAMEYYRDYFSDAGPENEEQVIALREEMAANNKEHEAFNRRLKEHDQKLGQLNELTLAISRLTDANVNVTRVLEQVKGTVQRLDTRMESIEHEPGEKWKKITFEIIKYLVLAAVGVAAGYFIKG